MPTQWGDQSGLWLQGDNINNNNNPTEIVVFNVEGTQMVCNLMPPQDYIKAKGQWLNTRADG